MRGIDLIWTVLALLGMVETFRLLLVVARTYRVARANSCDPLDWEMACHDLHSEIIRLVKQVIALGGICLSFINLPEAWRIESRNFAFVAISLLLLLNSERDLRFRRRAMRLPVP